MMPKLDTVDSLWEQDNSIFWQRKEINTHIHTQTHTWCCNFCSLFK